jgi:Transposase DDE domain
MVLIRSMGAINRCLEKMNNIDRRLQNINKYLNSVFDGDVHAKRVASLANATLGVMASASLAVSIIGQALAQARGLLTKHAVKQVDRLLSNEGIVVWDMFAHWVPEVIGTSKVAVIAMDWTDFDADDQSTLVLSLVTAHGRATPLLWLSVLKDELKDARNDFEDLCLTRLATVLPAGVAVTILADRGFGDSKLFKFLEQLGFAYVIRFRGNIHVTAADGETRAAADWVGKDGRARKLRDAGVTVAQQRVGAVVCVHAKNMKDAWCLAASNGEATAREITNYYAKRWTIEPGFRDTKDLRFGMGLGVLRIADPQRRDRLLLLNAFAITLLTLLGAAGESLGMDRHLKVNTAKHRTHSLFRQGCMLYDLIPNMPEARLAPLIARFNEFIRQKTVLLLLFPTVQ